MTWLPAFQHLQSTQATLDVNKLMKTDDTHTNVSSVYFCWARDSLYICFSSPWACWTSSPHGQGNTEESAQWEFREVNKWVWNASVSHAAYLDTQALRKHVSGLSTANWNSRRFFQKGHSVWGAIGLIQTGQQWRKYSDPLLKGPVC